MRKLLLRLKEAGHTIIISEHRLFYLNGLADRFLIMNEGRITGVLFAFMGALIARKLLKIKIL